MKKFLIIIGISSALAIAACETPQPSSSPNNTDSTNTAQPDSSMNRGDTTRNQ